MREAMEGQLIRDSKRHKKTLGAGGTVLGFHSWNTCLHLHRTQTHRHTQTQSIISYRPVSNISDTLCARKRKHDLLTTHSYTSAAKVNI